MSSSDLHSAQPRASAALDPPLAAHHSQLAPARARSPPPPARVPPTEATRPSQFTADLDRGDTSLPALASAQTLPAHPSLPPPLPQLNNNAPPTANVRSADRPTLPQLSALPTLGDIMPLPQASSAAAPTTPPVNPQTQSRDLPPEGSDNGSQPMSEEDDDGGDGESEEEQAQQQSMHRRRRWRPLVECTDVPSKDELEHIVSKGEHNAEDMEYWEKKTFFPVDDPDIVPVEQGRIHFTVAYNGTKEKPNKERVMLSEIVQIGGYDWRIKFYPRGDDSSYLSCYVECVTMNRPEFEEFRDFQFLPLPQLAGEDTEPKLRSRHSVAAQIGVLMYNPSEPRVNEFQFDAHQYKRDSADYGWQKFSYEYYDSFHQRRFGQRTAILKDDTLAFTAFIQVMQDPTGCLWAHDSKADPKALYNNSLVTTGLRPFASRGPELPAMAALLHIPQFRSIIHQTRNGTRAVYLLQTFLMKMMSRKCSDGYGNIQIAEIGDAVSSLQWFAQKLVEGCEEKNASLIKSLVGTLRPEDGYVVGGNRLRTKGVHSLKEAVLTHHLPIPCTTLLTLELQRQHFDSRLRRWRKLTNKVEMDETLQIGDTEYSLYAYVTHNGGLMSNKHTLYVRPRGVGSLWYGYREGKMVALTHKQAAGTHCGSEPRKDSCKNGRASLPLRGSSDHAKEEVAYVVFYLEAGKGHFDFPEKEIWGDIPEVVAKAKLRSIAKASKVDQGNETAGYEIQAQHHRAFGSTTSGSETPQWRMDGDDVVMSDAEDNDPSSQGDPLAASAQLTRTANGHSSLCPHIITVDALGQDYYSGEKIGDMRHGSGHLITMTGDEYTGEFQHNHPHGQGTMIYAASGSTYTGAWQAGAHHGQGTLTESNGNKYVGGWEYGRKHGAFQLTGTFTDEDKSCCNICYSRDISTAFYDCGHVVACHECATKIDNCPVCRRRVLARVQLYGVRVVMD
nr:phosphatidylinositol 4-phosphate 5-kinase 1 [Quercus suber]